MSYNTVLHVSVRTNHHQALFVTKISKKRKYILAHNYSVSEISLDFGCLSKWYAYIMFVG